MGGVVKTIGRFIGSITGANQVADAQDRSTEQATQNAYAQMIQQQQQADAAREASAKQAAQSQQQFEQVQAQANDQSAANQRMQDEQNARQAAAQEAARQASETAKQFQVNLANQNKTTGNIPNVVAGGTADISGTATTKTRKRKVSLASNLGIQV